MVIQILVREVMQAPVETVTADASIADVAARLGTGNNAVIVVRDGEPIGLVARVDLVDRLAEGADVTDVTAAALMSDPVVTVDASAPIEVGAETLHDHDLTQAPVTDDGAVVGLLRIADLAPYLPDCAVVPAVTGLEAEERDWAYAYEDEAAPGISVGDVVTFSKPITERDLELFAEISGDTNRLHLDSSFARQTRFRRRIVHGALASSVISAALSKLPGLVIYLSQNVTYSAPVDIGERVTARCEVIADLGGSRYRLEVEEVDAEDTTVISGEATILVDPLPSE